MKWRSPCRLTSRSTSEFRTRVKGDNAEAVSLGGRVGQATRDDDGDWPEAGPWRPRLVVSRVGGILKDSSKRIRCFSIGF